MRRLLIIVFALLSFSTLKADEGMWLLSLLKQQNIDEMQQMGFKLSAEDIYSVNKPGIKDAIVGLGYAERPFRHFCSGELVSPQGLMITNHHCGFSAIQEHSSVEHDYLSDGFWAYKMEDELTNPGITASILERMEDVTERVNAVLNDDMSTMEREIALDSISSLIVKEATENTDLSGQVISMFEGNQYFLSSIPFIKMYVWSEPRLRVLENSEGIRITGFGRVILVISPCSGFIQVLMDDRPNIPRIIFL